MVQAVPQLLSPHKNMQYPVYKDICDLVLDQIHESKELAFAFLSYILI